MDVWSFRDACRRIAAGSSAVAAASLLDLYRGPFLENEREEPWMLRARDRLRREFASAVATRCSRLERDGHPDEARSLRHGAYERDPLAFVRPA